MSGFERFGKTGSQHQTAIAPVYATGGEVIIGWSSACECRWRAQWLKRGPARTAARRHARYGSSAMAPVGARRKTGMSGSIKRRVRAIVRSQRLSA